jgi:hypothetical protein
MNKEQIHQIRLLLERLDAAVVVRDPGNARSAEAFDGLRKSILVSSKNHRTHIAHLLSLSDSLERGGSIELIRERVNDFLFELGVKRVSEPLHLEMFEIIEVIEGENDGFEVLEPAIVEQLENGEFSIIRLGKARRIQGPTEKPIETIAEESAIQLPSTNNLIAKSNSTKWIQWFIAIALGLLVGLLLSTLFDGSSSSDNPPDVTTPTELQSTSTTIANPGSTTTVVTSATESGE